MPQSILIRSSKLLFIFVTRMLVRLSLTNSCSTIISPSKHDNLWWLDQLSFGMGTNAQRHKKIENSENDVVFRVKLSSLFDDGLFVETQARVHQFIFIFCYSSFINPIDVVCFDSSLFVFSFFTALVSIELFYK